MRPRFFSRSRSRSPARPARQATPMRIPHRERASASLQSQSADPQAQSEPSRRLPDRPSDQSHHRQQQPGERKRWRTRRRPRDYSDNRLNRWDQQPSSNGSNSSSSNTTTTTSSSSSRKKETVEPFSFSVTLSELSKNIFRMQGDSHVMSTTIDDLMTSNQRLRDEVEMLKGQLEEDDDDFSSSAQADEGGNAILGSDLMETMSRMTRKELTALIAEANSYRDKIDSCVACMDKPRRFMSETCGHLVFCADCVKQAKSAKCPVCRQRTEYVKVHFS